MGSWKRKAVGFFKKKGKTHPITKSKKKTPGHYGDVVFYAPELHPEKLRQRRELANQLKRKGDVLEVFAGEGELTEEVYANRKVGKVVLVDKDADSLAEADRRLKGKVRREIVVADNRQWLANEMDSKTLRNLKLVDFDAYGSPADQIRLFFDNYPVEKPLLVALTDGSAFWVGFHQNAEGRRWLKKKYGLDVLPKQVGNIRYGTRQQQLAVLNKFMKNQGQKHGFKVEPVNVAFGDRRTIYAGYKVTPKPNS